MCCVVVQVFYRENLERVIERTRDIQLRAVCRVIYGVVCTVIARFEYSVVHTYTIYIATVSTDVHIYVCLI